MRIAIVSFLILLGLAELHPWMQNLSLPFPVLMLAGVGLAIGSNANKRLGLFNKSQPANLSASPPSGSPSPLKPSTTQPSPTSKVPQLPNLQPTRSPQSPTRSISFEIRTPKH